MYMYIDINKHQLTRDELDLAYQYPPGVKEEVHLDKLAHVLRLHGDDHLTRVLDERVTCEAVDDGVRLVVCATNADIAINK